MANESVHEAVRARYGAVATASGSTSDEATNSSCCGGSTSDNAASSSCCGDSAPSESAASSCCGGASPASTSFGYTIDELRLLPDGADLGLGCGNPSALAGLREGETVLDLGSGAGIDCFLAAARVGDAGRVIGVDMTPAMLERARSNAEKAGATNVEFRLGEIEHLPVADASVDVIISNCVINLAPDKRPVLAEAFRVLKPSGRLMVSDLVLERELPDSLRENMTLLTGCIAGAMLEESFLAALAEAGFADVKVEHRSEYLKRGHLASLAAEAGISEAAAGEIAESLRSVSVAARKG